MSLLRGSGRGRAFLRFLLAIAWMVAAYFLSDRAAHGFSHGVAFPLTRNLFEIFLLIIGYSYMELSWDNVREPLRTMGLSPRTGAGGEFALGAALGWGMVAAVLLVVVLIGHFYVQLSNTSQAWSLLVVNVFTLAAGSLAAEIAFRGYPFQKLIQATGPMTAAILAGIFFGLLRFETPGATTAAMWISAMAAVVLSVAYLRTRALWLCWGLHFGWLASIGILFGQPLAGRRHSSSVVRSYVDGPTWLTGSEYGPEASIVTLLVLWIGLYVLVRLTRGIAVGDNYPQRGTGDPSANVNRLAASAVPVPVQATPTAGPVRIPSSYSPPASREIASGQVSENVRDREVSYPVIEPPNTEGTR